MKYGVGYTLPYLHHVQVGIEADTPKQAIERAQALFEAGEIWDDTPEHPLLRDDYDEDADDALVFKIEGAFKSEHDFPVPDSSVKDLRSNAQARAAARALVAAYRNGEANGGSID